MKNKIEAKIKKVGKMAYSLKNNNYIVLFPEEIEFDTFGYVVDDVLFNDEIKVGDKVIIDNSEYTIKDLSENFNDNIKNDFQFELILDRDFDGENQILLEGPSFPNITEGINIIIKEN